MDDYIITRLNNVPQDDVQAYIGSYQAVMDFLKEYQPKNLKMTITTVGSQFTSEQAFDESLQKNLAKLATETPGGLSSLTETQRKMVELNAKPDGRQLKDPLWREKIFQLHNAYMLTKAEPGYHKDRPEKILAFTQPLPSGVTLSVGTTKSSIMKFWVGAGVLRRQGRAYSQIILSPGQLQKSVYTIETVSIDGLRGRNFRTIRVIEPSQKNQPKNAA